MKKRSEAEWRALFEDQARSGLSASVFCRQRGLCPKHFSKRRRQLMDERAIAEAPAFVPARVAPASPRVEVQAGEVRLHIPVSVPAVWLAELVRSLA